LVCWADERGYLTIFNSLREKEVTKQDLYLKLESKEVVKKIIHTHPRSSKLFILTQFRVLKFDCKISDSRENANLTNLDTVPNLKPAEGGFIDMIYDGSLPAEEIIYLIDSENLFSLNPYFAITNPDFKMELFSTDFRTSFLRSIVGRYSQTQKSFIIYLGDNKGTIKVYDPKQYIITNEIEIFPERHQGPKKRTTELT